MMDHTEKPLPENLLVAWAALLGRVKSCQPLSEKNFVYLVEAERGTFILKQAGLVNPQGDVARKLAADLGLLRYLRMHGQPVAVPEPTDDGLPFLQQGEIFYSLTRALPNLPGVQADAYRLHYNTGTAIARLHHALAAYDGPIYSWRMDLPPRIFAEALPVIQRHQDAVENQRLAAVLAALQPVLTERLQMLPAQYIHGDCHGGNVLWVGETVSGFIDLDHVPYGPRAYDLAYYMAMDAIHRWQDAEKTESWFTAIIPGLLAGYMQEIELTQSEVEAIPYLMLGILLILVGWLFEPVHISSWARDDLQLFFWIYANLERVRSSCQMA